MSAAKGVTVPDCTQCGACCAFSYNWVEFDPDEDLDGIPESMCDCETGRMRCEGDRCVALVGEIGKSASCAVYASRPQVCREFQPGTAQCHTVRAHFGLEPAQEN